jgi:hypothetical protein
MWADDRPQLLWRIRLQTQVISSSLLVDSALVRGLALIVTHCVRRAACELFAQANPVEPGSRRLRKNWLDLFLVD